jgi:hypothetical protein
MVETMNVFNQKRREERRNNVPSKGTNRGKCQKAESEASIARRLVRVELPGNVVLRLWLIGTEVAGADRGCEIASESRTPLADLVECGADTLCHHQARAFRMCAAAARVTTDAEARGQFGIEEIELLASARRAANIVETISFVEFHLQLFQPASIVSPRARIERWIRSTKVVGYREIATCEASVGALPDTGAPNNRHQFFGMKSFAGMRKKNGDVGEPLNVSKPHGRPLVREGPEFSFLSEDRRVGRGCCWFVSFRCGD